MGTGPITSIGIMLSAKLKIRYGSFNFNREIGYGPMTKGIVIGSGSKMSPSYF